MKQAPSWSLVTPLAAVLALLVTVPSADAKGGSKPAHPSGGHHAAAGHAGTQHFTMPSKAPQPPKAMHLPKMPKVNTAPMHPQQVRRQQAGARRSATQSHPQTYRRSYARHRSYSSGRRYASNSGNNRAIIQRLRSTHASLSRINREYQGHRVKAMHAIGQAIRQLEHRSGGTGGAGFAAPVHAFQNRNRAGAGGAQAMSQAQSDARMQQARRTLQSVHQHLTNNVTTVSYARVRSSGSVRRAIQELNLAMRVR
jgi:hypothetical protein